ncbi:hypothetical protein JW998_06845 [candidate division KSB1 bacterium]|nr:hypothetical protein [candidate division KSB1 bacterium]
MKTPLCHILCVSDIILSGAIEPAADESRFRLEDLAFRPHMFWAYRKDETVGIYLEVYNLSPLPSGKTSFDLICTLKEKEKRQNLMQRLFRRKQEVSVLNHYDGSARDERIHINKVRKIKERPLRFDHSSRRYGREGGDCQVSGDRAAVSVF